MTTTAPSVAPQSPVSAPTARQYIRYLFYKVRPSWHQDVRADEHARCRQELVNVLAQFKDRMAVLRGYSTLGTRGDADFMLWMVSERLEDFQELQSAVLHTEMGDPLRDPFSYLAMTRRSQYVDKHVHDDGEGEGRRTRVQPARPQVPLRLPDGEKASLVSPFAGGAPAAMDEHIRVGHEFPRVKINTSYSFGLDDQEFVVAFETDYPSDFLDLVESLRGGESSAYTERETPIFTCVAGSFDEVLGLLA